MGKTMLDQIATNQALYEASRGGRRMGNVSASQALLSAAMIERQKANADGYSYSGGYYGSFVGAKSKTETAIDAALIIQNGSVADKKSAAYYISRSNSYSYAGGSYGRFVDQDEEDAKKAMEIAQTIDGGVGAGNGDAPAEQQPTTNAQAKTEEENGVIAFLKKHKLWVIAAICTALYFVLRKK